MNNIQPNGRLASLDALRGFDMLFIAGLAYLIRAICCLFWSAYLLLNYLILRLMYKKDIFIKV